jgi:CRISPR/Cas system-associated exonuclease Cas4 (RecB family)
MLEIIECEQGSEAWFTARAGIPTASEFATVMAKGKGNAESVTRRKYMLKLLGERMTGQIEEGFTNHHMERGKVMEEQARKAYALMEDAEPKQIGFIRNGDKGASPDSLIGADGMLEIKTKLPHLQLEVLLADTLPAEHKAQVQGQLWVAEREWCDFCSFWPGLPLFVTRVYRDEEYIKTIAEAVERFLADMNEIHEQLNRRYAA